MPRCAPWTAAARVAEFLVEQLQLGENFIDIEAWIGLYAMLASSIVGQSGYVYAFEAPLLPWRTP